MRTALVATVLAALAAASCPSALAADAPPPAPVPPAESGSDLGVDIVGARPILGLDPDEGLRRIAGAGLSLDRDVEVKWKAPTSVADALRGQPGVILRNEDPAGLVPNIGMRGLNPDRSERMLVLEDGVPVGLAPYIENASYFFPPFERMARVEVLKGSGQILYGPHTVGGVLNLVTPEIPLCPSGRIRTVAGSHGYLMGYGEGGGTFGPFGLLVSVFHKRGDGFKDDSDFEAQDVTIKGRWTFSDRTNLTAKLNWYRHETHQSYIGLTTGLYEADAFQHLAPNDVLDVDWWSGQVTLRHQFSSCVRLLANAYVSDAQRNWNRQDYARNVGFAAPPGNTVETYGDTAVDGGAVYMRSSFGSRDRYFLKWGVEPRLLVDWWFLGRPTELEVGARWHEELMIDERNNRATFVSAPVTRDRDIRRVDALAGWARARFPFTDCFDVTAGLRVEHYDTSRHIVRQANADVDIEGDSTATEWIPGLGATYRLGAHTLFAGVHRGYAPPRTADAIASDGEDLELDPERSWNYELGVRGEPCTWARWSATGFYNDYTNLVIPANESGGASTANTNGGEVEIYGLELAGSVELLSLFRRASCCAPLDPCATRLWLDLSYTWLHAENTTPNGLFKGKRLPYAPEHAASAGLRLELPSGFDLGAFAVYTGEQYADRAETKAPSNTGLVGRIEDRWVVDLVAGWDVPGTSVRVSGAVRNLFDETYIASRAPEGIFPGAPRHWYLGVELDF